MPTLPHVQRFDAPSHTYTLDGTEIPNVTGMLEHTGYIDDSHYTPGSKERGHKVHKLTADFDLGAISRLALTNATSDVKGYVLGYVKALDALRPTWRAIEVALIDPVNRFGGRPDRNGLLFAADAIVELKSGGVENWHPIQTAFHDILLCAQPENRLPLMARKRWALYLHKNGKFKLQPHEDHRDYDRAREILRTCRGL